MAPCRSKNSTLRISYAIHRWTSLHYTLKVLCVPGRLLIFHENIDALLDQEHHGLGQSPNTPSPAGTTSGTANLVDAALAAQLG
ncbi:hypothetical protein PO002_38985 [Cupriavidus necator]|uniref:hypothetical protein n=1 Tax=Cupriavidus necator TaxID=106590 RepID=UPI0039C0808A